MEKYYKIGYDCGCGDNEEYITAKDDDAATEYAYQSAVEEYHSFEGLHGVLSEAEIAEELFGDIYSDDADYDFDLDSLTDEQWDEVNERYAQEIENSINYWAEEISHREYLIGIGEIDEDDEYDEEDEDDE